MLDLPSKIVCLIAFRCAFTFNFKFILLFFFVLENRGEFLEKLQRARAAVRQGTPSQPIMTNPGPHKIVVGNWVLQSQKEQQLHIHNSEGHQVCS